MALTTPTALSSLLASAAGRPAQVGQANLKIASASTMKTGAALIGRYVHQVVAP